MKNKKKLFEILIDLVQHALVFCEMLYKVLILVTMSFMLGSTLRWFEVVGGAYYMITTIFLVGGVYWSLKGYVKHYYNKLNNNG